MPHNHKYYSLKLKGIGTINEHTSNVISYSHRVILKIKYKGVDSTQRITNEGLFMTLIKSFGGQADFMGFITDPDINDQDDKHIIGNLEFYFGQDSNT